MWFLTSHVSWRSALLTNQFCLFSCLWIQDCESITNHQRLFCSCIRKYYSYQLTEDQHRQEYRIPLYGTRTRRSIDWQHTSTLGHIETLSRQTIIASPHTQLAPPASSYLFDISPSPPGNMTRKLYYVHITYTQRKMETSYE